MTMIPPKIKKLPNLHKPQSGHMSKTSSSSTPNTSSLYLGGAKMKNK